MKTAFFILGIFGMSVGLLSLLQPSQAATFLSVSPLWIEPIIGGILVGILSALLGLYLIFNRVVFAGLAISQSSGMGIFSAYYLAHFFPGFHFPLSMGILVALLAMALTVKLQEFPHLSSETVIALLFVIASAGMIFLSDRLDEGHHEMERLLFGNAVAISWKDIGIFLAGAIPVLVLHGIYQKKLLAVSMDADFAKVSGVSATFWKNILFATFVVGITLAVKTLGSLPVLGLMTLPPFISLMIAKNLKQAFIFSLLMGLLIPPLGYYFSFLYEFPTGASIILSGAVFLMVLVFKIRMKG